MTEYIEQMKNMIDFLLANPNLLMLVGLLAVLVILLGIAKTPSPFQNALLDDKVVVKRKDPYLDDKVRYLIENLPIQPREPYTLSKEMRKSLCKDRFGQSSIQALVYDILKTIGVPYDNFGVKVNIDKTSRFEQSKGAAGLYIEDEDTRTIQINLKDSYSLNEVVAIICHECSHAFLNYYNVRLPDTAENEVLTDTCAIYLGFAQYLLAGYKPVKRIASITQTSTQSTARIQSSFIGYLNLSQLEYVCKVLRKIKKQALKNEKRMKNKK